MKQKIRSAIALVLLGLFSIIILSECFVQGEPGIEAAESHFQRDLNDLQNMVQWMLSTEYESIAFWRWNNFMLAELEHLPIDESIRPTLDRLYHNGYQFISMDREENTIVFEYWSRTMGNQSCGLAYALDEESMPIIQFMTEIEPLSAKGWYYYFTDYETWRVNH